MKIRSFTKKVPSCLGPLNLPSPLSHKQRGQGMTEYIIIVALIAVAAIGTYTLFGQTLRNQTAGLALELSGQTAAPAIANANTNATTASTNANNRKGLDNFDLNNR
jgi:Flp pilus assembly pilin Flp